jgi:hypothetical protein
MLRFEVRLNGQWVACKNGNILPDGRLGYTTMDGRTGVAEPPRWWLSELTTRDPRFREMCWNASTDEIREAAVARMGRAPTF